MNVAKPSVPPKKDKGPKCIYWFLTINNYGPVLFERIKKMVADGHAVYAAWCEEHTGPRPPMWPTNLLTQQG